MIWVISRQTRSLLVKSILFYILTASLYTRQCRTKSMASCKLYKPSPKNDKTNCVGSREGWLRRRAVRLQSVGCSGVDGQWSHLKLSSTRRWQNFLHCHPLWLFSFQQPGRREGYNWTMSRVHTFTFSDCVENWCLNITDDKKHDFYR